jgi:ADP-heptose:LPS heptosyltransferase
MADIVAGTSHDRKVRRRAPGRAHRDPPHYDGRRAPTFDPPAVPPVTLRLMHLLDYWLGIPLCALLSVAERVRTLLSPPAPAAPGRMLVIELSEMGSVVMAYPALSEAVERLGAANVWFLTFERNRDGVAILGLLPESQILTISDRSLVAFTRDALRFFQRCRRERIDTVVDIEIFSRCTALLAWLSGARVRSGLSAGRNEGLYRGQLFTHPVLYSPHHHMARVYRALVRATFSPPPGKEPLLKAPIERATPVLPRHQPPPDAVRRVDDLLGAAAAGSRLVFFNPDPGLLPLRAWPDAHFAQLGRLIADACPDVTIVVVGVERARPQAARILSQLPAGRGINLAGRTRTLADLVALLDRGTALVTIDSGPAHFSGLTGIWRIVLFGPETPALYSPVGGRLETCHLDLPCSPCYSAANHRESSCTDNRCLTGISPESVFERMRLGPLRPQ